MNELLYFGYFTMLNQIKAHPGVTVVSSTIQMSFLRTQLTELVTQIEFQARVLDNSSM